MHSTLRSARHRKPSPARAVAARTAVSAGAAVAAVLMSASGAAAAPAGGVAGHFPVAVTAGEQSPSADPPCTDTPLDAIVGPLTGADCNSNPGDSQGETPDDMGGDPPPPGL